jgi:hypothetical protein
MIYEFKPRTQCEVPAQVVGETVERIVAVHGGITPPMLVEEARPPDAPLHPAFEWDDRVAGEKYRQEQAGYILRMLVVRQVDDDPLPEPMRAFVSVETPQGDNRYVGLVHAMSDVELRNQIVERAWRELLQWRSRYARYEEFANIFRAIDEVRQPRKLQ